MLHLSPTRVWDGSGRGCCLAVLSGEGRDARVFEVIWLRFRVSSRVSTESFQSCQHAGAVYSFGTHVCLECWPGCCPEDVGMQVLSGDVQDGRCPGCVRVLFRSCRDAGAVSGAVQRAGVAADLC